jgi:hypothetical protein
MQNSHAGWKLGTKATTMIQQSLLRMLHWNLWIWNPLFGLSGSLNDMSVLSRWPLFLRMLSKMMLLATMLSMALIYNGLLPCRWHLSFMGHDCECNPPILHVTRDLSSHGSRVDKEWRGESFWCALEALSHCSWPCGVLETTIPMSNNDMLHHLA